MVRVAGLVGLIALVMWSGGKAGATPGDTLVVQTFTFDSLSTRRASFQFPEDERSWERILMYYTLKCDEATTGDPYPCGEWDVTTHTIVHRPTGVLDSTRQEHPLFIVRGESPDEFLYTTEPRYHFYTYWDAPEDPREDQGHYLRFDGSDHVSIPPEALATLDSSLTVSCWVRGDPSQPQADHLFEAGDRGGRILNVHLPWNTGDVYFDAGGRLAGSNNRIVKHAAPAEYKGRWNHWAFTKDGPEMRIYLNGELWHEAGNMRKPFPSINQFVLGANCNANGGFFAGAIDDFRVWDAALGAETIQAWMFRPLDASHPAYEHLRLEYRFEEVSAEGTPDSSPRGFDGRLFGQPQRVPFGLRGRGDRKPPPDLELQVDRVVAPRASVRLHEDETDRARVTRTLQVWPARDRYFDGDGRWLEDVTAAEAETLRQETHVTYSEPVERIERFELGRFITPYGKGLDLGEDGFTWIYDVTDYEPLLRGEVDLQAANDFELLDLRFVFVEGLPPRDVLDIQNLWPLGSHRYGALADDEELRPVAIDLNPDAAGFRVRSRISGHGHAGPHNCCEWDAKEHHLLVKGIGQFYWTVWRDCGFNPVYPQGGTWQFDRAGWCPGTFVDTHDHELTPLVSPGETVALDYGLEAYDPQTGEEEGAFVVSHQLFTYGPPHRSLDAALEAIVAPSPHDEYRRLNPVAIDAVVKVRNLGATTLHSLTVAYGLETGEMLTHLWEGTLAFQGETEIVLPGPDWSGLRDRGRFVARIEEVNGRTDEHPGNNRRNTLVPAPYRFPETIVVEVQTPGFGRAADNSYQILDGQGRVHAERIEFEDDREYRDVIKLRPGAYRFVFVDREEDGLIRHWWLRGSDPERIGSNGALRILEEGGEVLVELGYDFAEKTGIEFFIEPLN